MKKLRGLYAVLAKANSYDELCAIVQSFKTLKGFQEKHMQFLAHEKQFIKQFIDDDFTLLDVKYATVHNILPEHKFCSICGIEVHSTGHSYPVTCSSKHCRYAQTQKSVAQTNNEKYGVFCCFSVPEIHEKGQQTRVKRYGNANNYEKLKQTLLKHHSVSCTWDIPDVREKSKQTMMQNIGYEYALCSPVVHEKARKTKLERYGDENYFNKEKYEQTCEEKFGVSHPMKCDEVKQKRKQSCTEHYGVDSNMKSLEGLASYSKSINEKYGKDYVVQTQHFKEKSQQTCLRKYGTRHHMQNKDILDKTRTKYHYDGQTFDSSWELAFWIYCIDNNIGIRHSQTSFEYVDEKNVTHKYFPDFEVDGQLIEIKGDDQFDETGKMIDKLDHKKDYIAEAKHQCMLRNEVKIMKGKDIQKCLDYVDQRYGKGYLKWFKQKSKEVQ